MWKLSELKLHGASHNVCRLAVHLEGQQRFYFYRSTTQKSAQAQMVCGTTHTEWFKLNEHDGERNPLCPDISLYYILNTRTKMCTPKQRNNISRIYTMNLTDIVKCQFRMLLLHVSSGVSFLDKRTVGKISPTFKAS